uniref:Uncharacterized protein n=1 Tax=Panagrolaimus sp. JU765 TaxID=591449 RepID=A0AC34QHL1_9BILA
MGHDRLLSGFKDGKPCFMLVFNKILGVAPKSKLRNGIDSVNSCHSKVVPIKCKSDVSNVSLQVYPKDGISSCMWPYIGQPDYIPPFAMLQVLNIPLETKIKIWCYADVDDLRIESDDEVDSAGHILKFFIIKKNTTTSNP